MIKKMSTIAALLFNTAVFAEEAVMTPFFKQDTGEWLIAGMPGNKDLNPACLANRTWRDGSNFMIGNDLKDGELFLTIENRNWNISGPYGGEYKVGIHFEGKIGFQDMVGVFTLGSKNTITMRGLNAETFVPAFMIYKTMNLKMPGTVQNATIDLTGTRDAMQTILKCIDSAETKGLKARDGMSGTQPKEAVPEPTENIKPGLDM